MKDERIQNRAPVTLSQDVRLLKVLRRISEKTRVPMTRIVEKSLMKTIPEIRDAMRNV